EEDAGCAGGGGNLVGHRAGPVGGDDQLVEVHADDRMHRVVDQRDKRPAVVGATQGEHADVVVNRFAGDAVLVVPAHFDRAVGVDDAAIVAGVERADAVTERGGHEVGRGFAGGGERPGDDERLNGVAGPPRTVGMGDGADDVFDTGVAGDAGADGVPAGIRKHDQIE